MVKRIEKDHARFRRIVRGRIKKNLKKYISSGELIGRKGKKLVSIPLPQIDMPKFRYGEQQTGGVGQGEGEQGQPIGGEGEAGDQPGQHILEVDITVDELAEILGEELELPNIEPRGKKQLTTLKTEYTGISRTGPESLKHFKRTYREALKRQISAGLYNPKMSDNRSHTRGQEISLMEARLQARIACSNNIYDGCLRVDGRRAEGNSADGGVLDRYLAQPSIQGYRDQVYCSRCSIQRS